MMRGMIGSALMRAEDVLLDVKGAVLAMVVRQSNVNLSAE
jgi:hypothetical protein